MMHELTMKMRGRDASSRHREQPRGLGLVRLEALPHRLALWLSRLSATVVAAMTLTLLPILAAASPPDPIWIHGIYDEADGDDVVVLVSDAVGSTHVDSPALSPLLCLSEELVYPRLALYEGLRELDRERGPPALSTGDTLPPDASSSLHRPLLVDTLRSDVALAAKSRPRPTPSR
jgi:hypothetical protein